MQLSTLLIRSILPFIATPALAAIDANSCTTQSSKMKPYERNAFIISCLTQLNTSASIKEREQQNKKALCEQNVKNLNLRENGQSQYLATCMNENQAQAVASKASGKTATNVVRAQEKKKKVAKPAPGHADTPAKTKSSPQIVRNKKRKPDELSSELAM